MITHKDLLDAFEKYGFTSDYKSPPYVPKEVRTRPRASSLGSCEIRHALERKNVKETNPELAPDIWTKLMFEEGNWYHEKWQGALEKAFNATSEKDVDDLNPQSPVSGRMDSFINEGDDAYVIEIKRTELVKPSESHLMQLSAYLLVTGVPHGYLILQGRGDKPRIYKAANDDLSIEWDNRVSIDKSTIAGRIETMQAFIDAKTLEAPMVMRLGECCKERRTIDIFDTKKEQLVIGQEARITPHCPFFSVCWMSTKVTYTDEGVQGE